MEKKGYSISFSKERFEEYFVQFQSLQMNALEFSD